ncbi:hypothetical protein V1520DRAFT_336708 [Lipomyces starkeyi]|uniref:Glycine zipper 2TM domain-containing protein n=1 Tax=Lipomyces starkeyi NRRL Y-11557 TaxID=675824 RepID=A0A1E3Q1M5_LIPST|nr:hypothetical protein LIPSTDRAFT_73309 [Lipomyces starkeyi NRRL Y-11557]
MSNKDYYGGPNNQPCDSGNNGAYQPQQMPYDQHRQVEGSDRGLGANLLGAVAGGFIGHKVGKHAGHGVLGGLGGAAAGATITHLLEEKFSHKDNHHGRRARHGSHGEHGGRDLQNDAFGGPQFNGPHPEHYPQYGGPQFNGPHPEHYPQYGGPQFDGPPPEYYSHYGGPGGPGGFHGASGPGDFGGPGGFAGRDQGGFGGPGGPGDAGGRW